MKLNIKSMLLASAVAVGTCITTPGDNLQAAPKNNRYAIPVVAPKDQICFAMYTIHNNTLKMMVQLYPLAAKDSRDISLEIEKDGKWIKVASSKIRENEYTSPKDAKAWNSLLRVDKLNLKESCQYRVVALDGVATYTGILRKNPVDKEEIIVAAFTGNSNADRGPRPDIIKNIKYQDPDLLFFSGDQSYDHRHHLSAWLRFGRQFGEIIKDRPTVAIPDDHDVGQGNLWGASGVKSNVPGGNDGGYRMPIPYVKEVEFAQTANLPDPYDPTPVERGLGVYYTTLNIGGIDFAIIEDRKFKSGPNGLVPKQGPRPDHIKNPNYDPKSVDVKGAILLGERQLKYLEQWGKDWRNSTFKSTLSATVFCNAAHLHGGIKNRLHADMDSNGWPQTGRNKAVKVIRKSFAAMISGDQHLATVVHHGVDEFNDSGFSFCVPSIVNYYNRWWWPEEKAVKALKTPLKFTGSYFDGFHNKITMYAYANPGEYKGVSTHKHSRRAAGYGLIRFNKKSRNITFECWPRGVDVSDPTAKQYRGWPITITQEDNYARKAVAYLPIIKTIGMDNPIIQVIDEANNEVVYTIRANGNSYRPKVFKKGNYTVIVGDQGKNSKTITNLKASIKKTNITIKF